jgi:hypothetical protein
MGIYAVSMESAKKRLWRLGHLPGK